MIKNRIAEVRKAKGFTQQKLAERLTELRPDESKVYAQNISQLEKGERGFSSKTLAALAEALEVEVGDLFFTSGVSFNEISDSNSVQ